MSNMKSKGGTALELELDFYIAKLTTGEITHQELLAFRKFCDSNNINMIAEDNPKVVDNLYDSLPIKTTASNTFN